MQVPMLTALLVKTHLFESFCQDIIQECSRRSLSQVKSHSTIIRSPSEPYFAESGALSQTCCA